MADRSKLKIGKQLISPQMAQSEHTPPAPDLLFEIDINCLISFSILYKSNNVIVQPL